LFAAVRGSVGVRTLPRWSDRVRSTGYCQFSTKYPPGSVPRCPTAAENGVMTKVVVSGGEGVDLRLRCITSSASQTFRGLLVRTTDDGRRGECSAQCLPPFVAALFFTLRDSGVDNTVDLYAAKRDIRPESRFLPTPPAFDAPVRGFPSEYRHPVWHGKN